MYRLSNILPVPMRSTYESLTGRQRATWWQWRGKVYRHRIVPLGPA
jgi:hypothetical protein